MNDFHTMCHVFYSPLVGLDGTQKRRVKIIHLMWKKNTQSICIIHWFIRHIFKICVFDDYVCWEEHLRIHFKIILSSVGWSYQKQSTYSKHDYSGFFHKILYKYGIKSCNFCIKLYSIIRHARKKTECILVLKSSIVICIMNRGTSLTLGRRCTSINRWRVRNVRGGSRWPRWRVRKYHVGIYFVFFWLKLAVFMVIRQYWKAPILYMLYEILWVGIVIPCTQKNHVLCIQLANLQSYSTTNQ